MSWIFKNRKGEEIRMSDAKIEEARSKIPDMASISIPDDSVLFEDNCYYKDRYEKD